MPELPEVETIVREMHDANLIGATIIKADVFWPRSIQRLTVDLFCHQIAYQTITNISRRGKFIVFTLSRDTLLVHLRMTGKFSIVSDLKKPLMHERVRLYLDDGRILRYEDQRKFGKWDLLNSPEEKFAELGLEPLSKDFTLIAFKRVLEGKSQQIKSFLLNQKFVVGLGNIYVDEALWDAKIHPNRRINTFSEEEISSLYHAIPKVLKRGVANMGTTLGSSTANYYSVSGRRGENQHQLNVFRQEGRPCPRCGTIIIKMVVSQRGTHICPTCQRV